MQSMTGYGRGYAEKNGSSVTIEVSSVNHKQRDIRFSLPPELGTLEGMLRGQIASKVIRGSLSVVLEYELAPEYRTEQTQIDQAVAGQLIKQVRDLAQHHQLKSEISPGHLLSVPGVVEVKQNAIPTDLIKELSENALISALEQLNNVRQKKKKNLAADLKNRLDKLTRILDRIEEERGDVLAYHKEQLQKRIAEMGMEVSADDQKLAQEAAYAAQKADISEEVVRLKSHLKRFNDKLNSEEAVGRELYFISQELMREINTLGAKTRNTSVADQAINFKTELDRVREQVFNIE